MTLNLNDTQRETQEINRANGWYESERPWSADISLLHTEVSEMVEAFRDHQLADATDPDAQRAYELHRWADEHGKLPETCTNKCQTAPAKPEGVGSEVADVLIRLLDTADRYEISGDEVASHAAPLVYRPFAEFTAATSHMHHAVSMLYCQVWESEDDDVTGLRVRRYLGRLYNLILSACEQFGIDLEFEVTRKLAYNRTRSYRHGGRTL